MGYEAGAAFESKLCSRAAPATKEPVVWYGCFDNLSRFSNIELVLPMPGELPCDMQSDWSFHEYAMAAETVLDGICAGHLSSEPNIFCFPADDVLSDSAICQSSKAPDGRMGRNR